MAPKTFPRRAAAALVAVFMMCTVGQADRGSRTPDGHKLSIVVGTLKRSYLLHVPNSLPGNRPAPLVLVFHGGGGHAWNMPRFTGFDDLADKAGFIVAYPESFNTHWNDGRDLSPADDVGFINALIAEVQRGHNIDAKRIYATGMSNGGFFSQRLACDLAGKIAAVASIAATMPEPLVPMCKPAKPVSVMFIQGTKDPLVPIDGGAVARTHGKCVSLAAASSFWRSHDQTSSTPASSDFPDQAHDGTKVHRDLYSGGKQGTEVVVYTIDGGGHTWPGRVPYRPVFLVGRATRNLNATQVVWEFFQKHSM